MAFGLFRKPVPEPAATVVDTKAAVGNVVNLIAPPAFEQAFVAKDKRTAFCAVVDRNGYLSVTTISIHNHSAPVASPGALLTVEIVASSVKPRALPSDRISVPILSRAMLATLAAAIP